MTEPHVTVLALVKDPALVGLIPTTPKVQDSQPEIPQCEPTAGATVESLKYSACPGKLAQWRVWSCPQLRVGLGQSGTYRPLAIPFQQRSSLAELMAIPSLHSVPGRLIQKSWTSRSCALASETCQTAVSQATGQPGTRLPAFPVLPTHRCDMARGMVEGHSPASPVCLWVASPAGPACPGAASPQTQCPGD